MHNKLQICREFIKTASAQIPSYAWDCTTPIVIAHDDKVQHFGTGTLFSVADSFFLVTAGHVIKQANEYDKTLAIGGFDGNNFISLTGDSLVSSSGQYGSSSDPFDVGIHPLAPDAVARLKNEKRFLHFDDIEFDPQPQTAVYTLFGFPGVWSSPSASQDENVMYKALQYTTYRYDRITSPLSDYQERLHLLLDGQLDQAFNDDASPVQSYDIDGGSGSVTLNLGGISGCSVWRIGDFSKPLDKWDVEESKLVAVQTGAYYDYKAIQATRWIAVSTLVHQAFPELRPAMKLLHL